VALLIDGIEDTVSCDGSLLADINIEALRLGLGFQAPHNRAEKTAIFTYSPEMIGSVEPVAKRDV